MGCPSLQPRSTLPWDAYIRHAIEPRLAPIVISWVVVVDWVVAVDWVVVVVWGVAVDWGVVVPLRLPIETRLRWQQT